jgi:hypothetical protein
MLHSARLLMHVFPVDPENLDKEYFKRPVFIGCAKVIQKRNLVKGIW